jgi:hypothetical protein
MLSNLINKPTSESKTYKVKFQGLLKPIKSNFRGAHQPILYFFKLLQCTEINYLSFIHFNSSKGATGSQSALMASYFNSKALKFQRYINLWLGSFVACMVPSVALNAIYGRGARGGRPLATTIVGGRK